MPRWKKTSSEVEQQQFSAIGTAITEQKKDHIIPTVQPTLSFTDLRPGQRGEMRELTIREYPLSTYLPYPQSPKNVR